MYGDNIDHVELQNIRGIFKIFKIREQNLALTEGKVNLKIVISSQ